MMTKALFTQVLASNTRELHVIWKLFTLVVPSHWTNQVCISLFFHWQYSLDMMSRHQCHIKLSDHLFFSSHSINKVQCCFALSSLSNVTTADLPADLLTAVQHIMSCNQILYFHTENRCENYHGDVDLHRTDIYLTPLFLVQSIG